MGGVDSDDGGEAAEGSGQAGGADWREAWALTGSLAEKDGVKVEGGMESVMVPLGRPATPDSPDVANGTHQKELLQGPQPQVLNLNDFCDFQRVAYVGEWAPCWHGEKGLKALQKRAPRSQAWLALIWGSLSNG